MTTEPNERTSARRSHDPTAIKRLVLSQERQCVRRAATTMHLSFGGVVAFLAWELGLADTVVAPLSLPSLPTSVAPVTWGALAALCIGALALVPLLPVTRRLQRAMSPPDTAYGLGDANDRIQHESREQLSTLVTIVGYTTSFVLAPLAMVGIMSYSSNLYAALFGTVAVFGAVGLLGGNLVQVARELRR